MKKVHITTTTATTTSSPKPSLYAFVQCSSPWLDTHIRAFILHHAPDAICVQDIADIPSPSSASGSPPVPVFQFCCGQQLSANFALLNRTPSGLINAYPNSDALARKDHLCVLVDYWTAKRPGSVLGRCVPQTVRLTLDYAEYVDEALMAADDLSLLSSLEDNEAKDPCERDWWILKPALVDCGAGIRLFSTVEELAGHLEEVEYESDGEDDEECDSGEEEEEEEEEADTASSSGEEPELVKDSDDSSSTSVSSYTPSLTTPGLSSLDLLVTTDKTTPTRPLRFTKPTYIFKEGGRIPSSEMRAFVAQRYLPNIRPVESRKWHLRAYVLAVGRLKVHVFREMLTLLAGEDYAPPWEYPSLKASLTNTALQDEDAVEKLGSMRLFSDMSDDLFPNKRGKCGENWKEVLFHQICDISGELFRAAAHTMADKFILVPKCFELFAVDFMVDDKGEPWLLEVNETPAFYEMGVAGGLSTRLMESVVCVAMEHLGVSHVGEARNTRVRRRMVDVLDETGGLGKSRITEILADR